MQVWNPSTLCETETTAGASAEINEQKKEEEQETREETPANNIITSIKASLCSVGKAVKDCLAQVLPYPITPLHPSEVRNYQAHMQNPHPQTMQEEESW